MEVQSIITVASVFCDHRYLFVRDDRGKVNSMIDRRNNEDVVGKKSGSDAT